MKFHITAPVKDFVGEVAGVLFHHGTATVETDEPGKHPGLAYFARKGYQVQAAETEPSAPAGATVPAKSAAKAEWVAYAVAQGADEAAANALTVAQLIEQYAPKEA